MGKKMKAYRSDNGNTTKVAVLETVIGQISQTLERLEDKIDNIDKKMDDGFFKVDKKIEELRIETKEDIKELRKESNTIRSENTSHFRTTMFALLTLLGSPLIIKSIEYVNHLFS